MRRFATVLCAVAALESGAATPINLLFGEPYSYLDLTFARSEAQICIRGVAYDLAPDEKGIAKIPGNEPIVIIKPFDGSIVLGSMISKSTCTASIGFQSVAGRTYMLNMINGDGVCGLVVVRKDESRRTGVAPEPSARKQTCLKQE